MKTYVSIIAIALCALIINVIPVNAGNEKKVPVTTECTCCKDCKDEKCKELCKKFSSMSAEEQNGAAGEKVKEECTKICKEKKCCSSDAKSSCAGMEGKGCCKKKK
ncbi:MAG: hypothetical protein IT235_02585 [Bacteroidia bacterium]|nr:hypothetical protein [Bacteroidia bacterium]